jgi:hypothetical protein
MTSNNASRLPSLPSNYPLCGRPLRYVARIVSNELVFTCLRDGWFRLGPELVLERLRPREAVSAEELIDGVSST